MKKAFTMIELVFVIVIIGILASVAMSKLASSSDDAEAQMCANEVGQLIHEIYNEYTNAGNDVFTSSAVSNMTNIKIIADPSEPQGITTDSRVHVEGVVYKCGGENIATLVGQNSGTDYNLTLTVTPGVTPVPLRAAEAIIDNISDGQNPRQFSL